jgi:hypothetical protein
MGNNPPQQLNRVAVHALLADAERVLVLVEVSDVGENKEIFEGTIANASHNYQDLARRRTQLTLTESEERQFHSIMARIQARIRFFGASV